MKKMFLTLLCGLLFLAGSISPVEAAGTLTPRLSSSGTVTKYVGDTFKNSITTDGKITYKSSKVSVATVDGSGKITCKKEGSSTITCTVSAGLKYKAKTLKFKVKVKKYTPSLDKTGTIEAYVGDKVTNNVKTTGKITYKSNKTSVATVSSKGVVTCKKAGTATISVYAKSCTMYKYKKLTYKVKVSNKPVTMTRWACPDTLNILMIGNSYTYRAGDKVGGGMFQQFEKLAIDNGKTVNCDMFFRGSTSMKSFYNGALSECAVGAVPAGISFSKYLSTTDINYDFVVVQYDGNGYTEEVVQLVNKYQPNAKVLLFLAQRTSDLTSDSADLREGQYERACNECTLAGCVRGTRTIANITEKLYNNSHNAAHDGLMGDKSGHLNAAGCFAMGATLYRTLYGELPTVKDDYFFMDSQGYNGGTYKGLNPERAKQILDCVAENF